MEEQTAQQILKQLKLMNRWITFFGGLLIVAMLVVGFLLWQVVGFVQQTNNKIESVQRNASDSLNLQKQACTGTSGFSKLVQEQTGICDEN